MLGELNEKEIEDLLTKQVTGRLGCYANGITYIVPVNYFYRNPNVFVHSADGTKIKMMRKNPRVCFQADDIQSIFRWRSVIAWGRFEEVTDVDEQQQAMQGLIHRIMPLTDNPFAHPSHGIAEKESDLYTKIHPIVFKITLNKKTGRFENNLMPERL